MRAAATVVAALDGFGRTLVRVAAGSPPLTPRVTGPGEVHLCTTAGGPLGGDSLCLDVEVGPGAALTVRTVAASVVLPGVGGLSQSSVRAVVGERGRLLWLPEPTVAAAGCDHLATMEVVLGADARLVLREELVGGRHGEASGLLRSALAVSRDGRPVLAQTLVLGGAARLVGVPCRAVGSLLVVGPPSATDPVAEVLGPWAVAMPLAHPGARLIIVLADDARSVRSILDDALADQLDPAPGQPPRVRPP